MQNSSWPRQGHNYGDSQASGHSRNLYGNHLGHSYTNQIYNYYGSIWDKDGSRGLPKPQSSGNSSRSESRARLKPTTTYNYSTLPTDSTRLLYLRTSHLDANEPLHIAFQDVKVIELGREQRYMALSLLWRLTEDGEVPAKVSPVDDRASDTTPEWNVSLGTLLLPANLANALEEIKALASADSEYLTFWADAACIDQRNISERDRVARSIPTIFEQASAMTLWLGTSNPETDMAMDLISNSSALGRPEDLQNPEFLKRCDALIALIQNPIFNHRWLVQELAFAPTIAVCCGARSASWYEFCESLSYLTSNISQLRVNARHLPGLENLDEDQGDLESLAAVALTSGVEDCFRRSGRPLYNSETVLATFENIGGIHSRHAITSLRAISQASEFSSESFRDPLKAYARFTVSVVNQKGITDIFCRPWAFPISDVNPPSWIRSIEESPYGLPADNMRRRVHADSFLGPAGRPLYNASKGTTSLVVFGDGGPAMPMERASSSGRRVSTVPTEGHFTATLTPAFADTEWAMVDGWTIGSVVWATDPVADGVIPSRALERIRGSQSNGDVPHKFWRTLVADRDAEGRPAPNSYRSACRQCLERRSANGHLNTKHLLTKETSESNRAYLRRVQAVVWNRCFFEVRAKDGSIWQGLGPSELEVNDIVAVLNGCSVLCILRLSEDASFPVKCVLVGEAYVHGLMDGEAIEHPVGPGWKPNNLSSYSKFAIY